MIMSETSFKNILTVSFSVIRFGAMGIWLRKGLNLNGVEKKEKRKEWKIGDHHVLIFSLGLGGVGLG